MLNRYQLGVNINMIDGLQLVPEQKYIKGCKRAAVRYC